MSLSKDDMVDTSAEKDNLPDSNKESEKPEDSDGTATQDINTINVTENINLSESVSLAKLGKEEEGQHTFLAMSDKGEEKECADVSLPAGSASDAFSKLLDAAGNNGKWQKRAFCITSFCGLFTAFNNLAAVFLAVTTDHHCVVPGLNSNHTGDLRNYTLPRTLDESSGKYIYSSCSYYVRNYTDMLAHDPGAFYTVPGPNTPTASCQSWHYDTSEYSSTIVSEWDLVCGRKWLMSSAQATYMSGVLVGAVLFSELSDKLGRRTIVLASAALLFVSSVAVAFAQSLSVFLVLRFIVAAAGSGLFLPNFVLLMEVVGEGARDMMGMMYQAFFSVGFCLLPLVAYFVRDWRDLQLVIAVPSAVLASYYWILPESPRWLFMVGRAEEALKVLRGIAATNDRQLPCGDELNELVTIATMTATESHRQDEENGVMAKLWKYFSSIITLCRTPNMRRRSIIIYFAWFVVSMVYYGLTFSGGNIDASIYVMVFVSGAVEIPSYLLVVWTMKLYGRRLNLCVLFVICGTACLAILAVPKALVWLNLSLASTGKFFNSAAFGVAYIYSAELVPTSVRNISVGTSSMFARIGSMLAPFIVDLMSDIHYTVPSTLFGVLSVSAGLLALLLPETANRRLPETVEEVEAMPR